MILFNYLKKKIFIRLIYIFFFIFSNGVKGFWEDPKYDEWHKNFGVKLSLFFCYQGYYPKVFESNKDKEIIPKKPLLYINDTNEKMFNTNEKIDPDRIYYTDINHWFLTLGINYRKNILKSLVWETTMESIKIFFIKSTINYLFFIKETMIEINGGLFTIFPFYFLNKNHDQLSDDYYTLLKETGKLYPIKLEDTNFKIFGGLSFGIAIIINDIFPHVYILKHKTLKIGLNGNWNYNNVWLISLDISLIEKPLLIYNIFNKLQKKNKNKIKNKVNNKNNSINIIYND